MFHSLPILNKSNKSNRGREPVKHSVYLYFVFVKNKHTFFMSTNTDNMLSVFTLKSIRIESFCK